MMLLKGMLQTCSPDNKICFLFVFSCSESVAANWTSFSCNQWLISWRRPRRRDSRICTSARWV